MARSFDGTAVRSFAAAALFAVTASSLIAAAAPAADAAARGKKLFQESQCGSCHSLTAKKEVYQVGPALLGVTERPGRTKEWLVRWIADPESMLRSDPLAKKLLAENANVPMTPMLKTLTLKPDGAPDTVAIQEKAAALYEFLRSNDAAAKKAPAAKPAAKPAS